MAGFPTIDALAAAIVARGTGAEPEGVRAAVMVCLRERDRGPEVLVGRRVERDGDPWSGQMGLPGGRLDPGESPLAAAVRETVEEVGFDPLAHGRLLGPLEPVHGGARQVVVATFAAAIASPVEPVASDELQAAWWMPFADCEERLVRVPEVPYRVPALVSAGADGLEAVVWGMTYRVLTATRALVG